MSKDDKPLLMDNGGSMQKAINESKRKWITKVMNMLLSEVADLNYIIIISGDGAGQGRLLTPGTDDDATRRRLEVVLKSLQTEDYTAATVKVDDDKEVVN